MSMAYLVYAWPSLLAGFISLSLAVMGWRRRQTPGAGSFILLMLAVALWALTDGLFLSSDALAWQLLWTKVQYAGIAMVPLLWVLTAHRYTGRPGLHAPGRLAALAGIPVLTVAAAWTLELHPFLYREYQFLRVEGHLLLNISYGPWWWVNVAYSYALFLWGAGLFLQAASRSFYLYRWQAMTLLTAGVLPLLGSVLHVFAADPFGYLDPTPFSFALSGVLVGWALFRFRLFDLAPVAREAVIEAMQEGLVVLDRMHRVVDLNPAAERILGRAGQQVVGRSAAEALGVWLGLPGTPLEERGRRRELHRIVDGAERVFALDVLSLSAPGRGEGGLVLLFHDVTEARLLGEELSSAKEEVQTLSGLLPVCAWCRKVRDDDGYWMELERYLATRSGTSVTHGICPACAGEVKKDMR